MRNKDIVKQIMAQASAAVDHISMLNEGRRRRGSARLALPPKAERQLKRIGYANILRDLRVVAGGGSNRRGRAIAQRWRKLRRAMDLVCPQVDPKLVGDVFAGLLECVYYAEVLSERLRDISRLGGSSKLETLNSTLRQIHEISVSGLSRQLEGLQQGLPLILDKLGAPARARRNRRNSSK